MVMRQSTSRTEVQPPFGDQAVAAVFETYQAGTRQRLLAIRSLMFEAARELNGVGPLVETLKWKQPAYLPEKVRVGTTIRIDVLKNPQSSYAIYFHCQTSLVPTFRHLYPDLFTFESNRAIHFTAKETIPRDALKHCIGLALSYHLKT
jgi:Domain of unknown function (DU1801)